MPTQKLFKRRVRARMTKTGESYTAARRQLLRHAAVAEASPLAGTLPAPPEVSAQAPSPEAAPSVSDEAMARATGRGHDAWFALLDAWGATERTHTEIAAWLRQTHGSPSWWTQAITVDYERARGMRRRHEQRDGFTINATKTIAVDAERALAAFTDRAIRDRWLPDAPLAPRPSRAVRTARFDWAEPPSRIVVVATPKDPTGTIVAVAHERLPDAATAERLKAEWRVRLGGLKALLERD